MVKNGLMQALDKKKKKKKRQMEKEKLDTYIIWKLPGNGMSPM